MKNEKDVLKLIKSGGGIFGDKDIEYYNEKPSLKGDFKNIEKYIKTENEGGENMYIYTT